MSELFAIFNYSIGTSEQNQGDDIHVAGGHLYEKQSWNIIGNKKNLLMPYNMLTGS